MPKGPQGQTRPTDAIGCAIRVAQIATGEAEEVADVGRITRIGSAGGIARSRAVSPARRKEIAAAAAAARWS